jgi:uncharacterized protein
METEYNQDMSAVVKKGSRNLIASKRVELLVREIVKNFRPQRIVLFGSQARGDADKDSDFDLLIIAPSDKPRWQRTAPVYKVLAGSGIPKDIVWWTPEEVSEWQEVKSHFISTVLREGVVLYENPA